MANAPRKVKVSADVDNTVTLKVRGEVFTKRGRELAARLNAVIAYWNTVLGRNQVPLDESLRLRAETGPVQTELGRALRDRPFEEVDDASAQTSRRRT
jgi:hypothetical protein